MPDEDGNIGVDDVAAVHGWPARTKTVFTDPKGMINLDIVDAGEMQDVALAEHRASAHLDGSRL